MVSLPCFLYYNALLKITAVLLAAVQVLHF